jgi:transposase
MIGRRYSKSRGTTVSTLGTTKNHQIVYDIYTMALFEKKMQATALRREGLSIVDIARRLSVAKSSVSVWCRDINLTTKQKERLQANSVAGGHRGRLLGAEDLLSWITRMLKRALRFKESQQRICYI